MRDKWFNICKILKNSFRYMLNIIDVLFRVINIIVINIGSSDSGSSVVNRCLKEFWISFY